MIIQKVEIEGFFSLQIQEEILLQAGSLTLRWVSCMWLLPHSVKVTKSFYTTYTESGMYTGFVLSILILNTLI